MPATLIPFPVAAVTAPLMQRRSRVLLQVGQRRFRIDLVSTIVELPPATNPAPVVTIERAPRPVTPPSKSR